MDMFKKKRHAPIKTIPGIAISEPGAAGVHGELSDAELAALQAKKKQERIDRCAARIRAVCEEESCTIDVSMLIEQGKITPIIKIVSVA